MNTIENTNFKSKRVLVRMDFNVPLDKEQQITDLTRIEQGLPTIQKLINDKAKIIIISHLGRPKKGGFESEYSLLPVAKELSKQLGKEVIFHQELISDKTKQAISQMKDGEVMLLENIRFYPQETKNEDNFSALLASLADCYVNDAFATAHRAHCSTCGVAKYFNGHKYFGLLMQKEVQNLRYLLSTAKRPFTAVIGGSKVSSKLGVLEALLKIVDNLIIGGGMRYTFYKALGKNIGDSLCEDDRIQTVIDLMQKAKELNVNLYLPQDSIIADDFSENANTQYVATMDIPDNWQGMDIGQKSIDQFTDIISKSQTILWNGPMGVFEMDKFATATNAIAKVVAYTTVNNGALSVIGGGDSVEAIHKSGYADKVSFISTGGGAMLEFLEGKPMPGIIAIEE